MQLPQLSIWGFGSSDEEEEDGDEAGKDAQKPTVYKVMTYFAANGNHHLAAFVL